MAYDGCCEHQVTLDKMCHECVVDEQREEIARLTAEVEEASRRAEQYKEEGQKDYDGMRDMQRKFIAADQKARELETQNTALREGLEDLATRAERAREVPQDQACRKSTKNIRAHENWGMLDTHTARALLASPSPEPSGNTGSLPVEDYAAAVEQADAAYHNLHRLTKDLLDALWSAEDDAPLPESFFDKARAVTAALTSFPSPDAEPSEVERLREQVEALEKIVIELGGVGALPIDHVPSKSAGPTVENLRNRVDELTVQRDAWMDGQSEAEEREQNLRKEVLERARAMLREVEGLEKGGHAANLLHYHALKLSGLLDSSHNARPGHGRYQANLHSPTAHT